MWLFRPRLCLGFGKPAPDRIVPFLDKMLHRISDKAAALRLRDGVQLSDGIAPFPELMDKKTFVIMERKGDKENGKQTQKRDSAAPVR